MKKLNEKHSVKPTLSRLIENELEKAESILASKAILDKIQTMTERLAGIEAEELMPLIDSLRTTYGADAAERFSAMATEKLRAAVLCLRDTKDAINNEVMKFENELNGLPSNDMFNNVGTKEPVGELDDEPALEMPEPAPEGDVEVAADLDIESDENAAGRMRKESYTRALRESKNPDALLYAAFKRYMAEGHRGKKSAQMVAESFSVDVVDVMAIVREKVSKA